MDTTTTSSSDSPVVAVVGSTGQQGGATAHALLDAGVRVRALVRDPGKASARALAARGAELVQADLRDPGSPRAALRGADRVFAMTTFADERGVEGEVQDGRTLADAAAEAGVGHLVYSSVGGAERETGVPHFESKRRVEEHIASLGLPATVLRPVFFLENLTAQGPTVEDGVLVVRLPLPAGVPLQMVAVQDIGTAAAAALQQPGRVPGGAIELAGDERTGEQIAAAFGAAAGLPARYEALPLAVLGGDEDMTRMFRWFAETPAYQGDLAASRALVPDLHDLPGWLQRTGWTPAG
ncbi:MULTISPECIES: NmrA/HSCARG family protein [unclassified Modestobacter]|uniref:NmrA/HSCARG family protein n=1 Tax=unclassified Modestobacter TaxID=2643866 RepID=UPI0022AA17C2|nr:MULTISPECIES: NmrA/HSCARG family protein [unclassified Modestobacter]MCZ2826604.1 NmrA/HSCARG family protein [Modestobacter sp. VKM Ac-2981]MCZ2854984.1 NmrA/HSCARG family protein [Modestobacter sp. VKM Ac-2982]